MHLRLSVSAAKACVRNTGAIARKELQYLSAEVMASCEESHVFGNIS